MCHERIGDEENESTLYLERTFELILFAFANKAE